MRSLRPQRVSDRAAPRSPPSRRPAPRLRAGCAAEARAARSVRALYGQRERRPAVLHRGPQGVDRGFCYDLSRGRTMSKEMPDQDIREASLEYHRAHPPGKISILPTKQLTNQRDLALAYTPGVAAAC